MEMLYCLHWLPIWSLAKIATNITKSVLLLQFTLSFSRVRTSSNLDCWSKNRPTGIRNSAIFIALLVDMMTKKCQCQSQVRTTVGQNCRNVVNGSGIHRIGWWLQMTYFLRRLIRCWADTTAICIADNAYVIVADWNVLQNWTIGAKTSR